MKGLAALAVVVLDEHDSVIYSQLVGEIATEPNYDEALVTRPAGQSRLVGAPLR